MLKITIITMSFTRAVASLGTHLCESRYGIVVLARSLGLAAGSIYHNYEVLKETVMLNDQVT